MAEAIALLAGTSADAKPMAGGQSLLPLMKLRLARPSVIVDLNRIQGLSYIRAEDPGLVIGALTRTADLEASELVQSRLPILAVAARHIGHTAIRHRGTVGGSLAHADPAAELPLMATLLNAQICVTGPAGQRLELARDFFLTHFTTTLSADELITEVRFPTLQPQSGWSFQELSRRAGDFALVAAAAVIQRTANGRVGAARVAVGGCADRPVRCEKAEFDLQGSPGETSAFAAAAAAAAAILDPPSDLHGSGEFRRSVATVLIERALDEAWQRSDSTLTGAAK